jgi:hypothetical protein
MSLPRESPNALRLPLETAAALWVAARRHLTTRRHQAAESSRDLDDLLMAVAWEQRARAGYWDALQSAQGAVTSVLSPPAGVGSALQ